MFVSETHWKLIRNVIAEVFRSSTDMSDQRKLTAWLHGAPYLVLNV